MPTYISLLNWTEQGIRDFSDTVSRANSATELAQRMGGRLINIYWTVGQFDLVVLSEFPDDETSTAYLLQLSADGNVRTSTLRAFNSQEIRGIIQKLG